MSTQIFTGIQRASQRGEQPRFIQFGKGVFGLSKRTGAWPGVRH